MIRLIKSCAFVGSLSPNGNRQGTVVRLTALGLSVLFLVSVMSAKSWGLTVTTGPMQEYLFAEGKKQYDAGQLDRAAEVWTNIVPDSLDGPIKYLLLARG